MTTTAAFPSVLVPAPRARRVRTAADRAAVARRLQRLAWLLDSALHIPGTNIRLGLDALIGLIPGVGDAISAAISAYIVVEAARLGASRRIITLMVANIAIDTLVGSVPVLGDLIDITGRTVHHCIVRRCIVRGCTGCPQHGAPQRPIGGLTERIVHRIPQHRHAPGHLGGQRQAGRCGERER